ncbi:haloacid dehalogenase type II [Rhodococcus sp. BP-252]|uniref:haloacid dehalogenase type II n=1 Tax=unclassified Rhodococcus (in: high G+C Gram-positive bacteria) TaxID=192944 RepID=UPI000DF2450D|nr:MULTISPECIES: haloacid dehalogenase type II [unclassified Rhodococcus (in: high G+C Gram-positive bacteria)]MBY6413811.1 haloacid dehalogenase type II [Rhodococcus sp. BP-320]MBY6419231.1 haloacid dehalogenase type II [Rhodococcus sp. BP-321]MBY6424118.1 haloacid dehalogenase type II [Rhodococcus sp. BP-324]MBY6428616.1 haloacid dehalogenase type II [Rhodococcus sp. BP-323]MBY6434368.1 haloacid dehalogenase type II [Rhodococcus sp. BP-322]
MTAPKALLFDVFGTVVDWRTSVAAAVSSALPELQDPYSFADRWRSLYQPSMEEVRSGSREFVRLDELHRESLRTVLSEQDIELPDAAVDDLNLAWHRLDPWPDSVDGITRLKEHFVVAPLSNGNISLLLDMAKNAGIPWDAILGAEPVRAYKPTPDAYLRTADILGLRPDECMMVAAHNSDLDAARNCGFRTAFVCRPSEHGPQQNSDMRPESDWSYSVESITELATALHC